MAKRVEVRYFAILREEAGRSSETIETDAASLEDLYQELSSTRGFTLSAGYIRAAVNGEWAKTQDSFESGDTVVFIPPVAGG